MKRSILFNLFDGEGDGGSGSAGSGNGSQGNTGATYSFEQAEEIANARAERAEKAALKSYFKQQGMTEEQVNEALADYREKQKNSKPDVTKIQGERDQALKELQEIRNQSVLTKKGVKEEDLDYVMFKVSKMVDDKTDFTKAADKFLKENPRYSGTGYRISTGTQPEGGAGGKTSNEDINAAIRQAARR